MLISLLHSSLLLSGVVLLSRSITIGLLCHGSLRWWDELSGDG